MPNTDQTPAGLNLIVIQFYSFLKNCANFLKCTFVRVTVLTCSVLLFFSLPDIVRMMVRSMFNVVYWIIVIHSMCWNDRTWHTSVVLHHNVPSFVKGATSRWFCSFGQQFCANVITSFLYPNTQKMLVYIEGEFCQPKYWPRINQPFQGHPSIVSSWTCWKHFLSYAEYF